MSNTISNGDDIIDLRDAIAEIELLESELEDHAEEDEFKQERARLATLVAFMEETKGYGGDEQWRGDWYPIICIRDSYFTEYAQELAEDIGAINRDAVWPANCIDWAEAARELQMDYTCVEFDGVDYWVR